MPDPSINQVHVNRPLTNISVAYLQRATNFIAGTAFPRVPVSKQSDKFFTYPKEYWHRSEAKVRAPATESAGSGYSNSTDVYSANVVAVHKDIDDQTRANADAPLDMDRDATEWVTHQLLIKREADWVTNFFTTGIWTGSTTGTDITVGTQWGTNSSTPIEDVTAQSIAVSQNTGYKPNTLVIGPQVFDALRHHPDIIDRIKHVQRGVVTLDLLPALFDVDRVLVPYAVQNSAVEGANASMSFLYGKHALLCYSAPSPGLLMPSAGYTFDWTGYLGANQSGSVISRFRIDLKRSDRIEGEMAYAQKVVAADCAAFFNACVA